MILLAGIDIENAKVSDFPSGHLPFLAVAGTSTCVEADACLGLSPRKAAHPLGALLAQARILTMLPEAASGYIKMIDDGLAGDAGTNHRRDELLVVLAGTIIVGAVGDRDRKPIRPVIGAHEVVARRLRRRVRGVWLVGGRLVKRWIVET